MYIEVLKVFNEKFLNAKDILQVTDSIQISQASFDCIQQRGGTFPTTSQFS